MRLLRANQLAGDPDISPAHLIPAPVPPPVRLSTGLPSVTSNSSGLDYTAKGGGLSAGAIAGISVGSLLLLLCLCGACVAVYCWISPPEKKEGALKGEEGEGAGKTDDKLNPTADPKEEDAPAPVLVLKKRSSYRSAAGSSTRGPAPSSAYSDHRRSSGRSGHSARTSSSAASRKGSSRVSKKSSLGRKGSVKGSRKRSLAGKKTPKASRKRSLALKKSFKGAKMSPAPEMLLLVPTGKGSWTCRNLKG